MLNEMKDLIKGKYDKKKLDKKKIIKDKLKNKIAQLNNQAVIQKS